MKTKYFDVHLNFGLGNCFSAFLEAQVVDKWINDDVIGIAIDQGKIEPDDDAYVDNVTEITKEEYEKATADLN